MAEIPEASSIRTILPADKHARDQKRKREQTNRYQEAYERNHPDGEPPHDVFTVADVPVEEITPRVQAALGDMMGEIDRLREELSHARSHILYLEELSETHTYLPVMNRRGLHRELSRLLALGERAGVINTFVCFHVRNIEEIRRRFGHGAAQAGLTWAAECLYDNCRDTDIVGSLGGHDFGVILTLADSDSASEKGAVLATALENGAFPWDGERLALKTTHGLHSFEPGDNAESVIQRADDDLLRHEREIKSDS